MTTPLTEAREAEIRADCEKAFVHQMDSERTVREDRELLLTALDSERAKVAEAVKALEKLKSEAEEWMHFDECGCSRTTECDEADGFRCAEHENPSDCPACECGRGTVVGIVDAALSRARQA